MAARQPTPASPPASCAGGRTRLRRAHAAPVAAGPPQARQHRPRRAPAGARAPSRRSGRGGTRCAGSRAAPYLARQLREHGRHPVRAAPRRGRKPLADLALHHRDPRAHPRQLLDCAQQHARRHSVRQVRHDLLGCRLHRAEVDCHRVRPVHVTFACASVASRSASRRRSSISITCTCAVRSARYSESTPRPPPTSSTTSSRRQLGRAADHAEDVGVDQEVLAELAVRAARRSGASAAGSAGPGRRAARSA